MHSKHQDRLSGWEIDNLYQPVVSLVSGVSYVLTERVAFRWSLSQASDWEGFSSELALYKSSNHMRPLQGVVVPHIIGVYMTPGFIDIAMELPHPCFWIEASPDMPHSLKQRCVEAFERLHQQGILHGDVELRHMLIGADCKVTIIDFQLSRSSIPIEEVGLHVATPEEFRMEMRRVKYKLDFQEARAREYAKMHRTAALANKNQQIALQLQAWGKTPTAEDFIEPRQEDLSDPAVPIDVWSEEWIIACTAAPTRFIVPGQTANQVEAALNSFLSCVAKMESQREKRRTSLVPYRRDLQPEAHKRKRDTDSETSSSDNDHDGTGKRRRVNAANRVRAPFCPLAARPEPSFSRWEGSDSSSDRPRHRKRKRIDPETLSEEALSQLSFSEFMMLSEIERDWERDQVRKKRKSSLTSITADYGSDCGRSSPPPTPTVDDSSLTSVWRRSSPCLSAEEAAVRVAAMSSACIPLPTVTPPAVSPSTISATAQFSHAIKSSIDVPPSGIFSRPIEASPSISGLSPAIIPVSMKPPPRIIFRDFVTQTHDGPKGYYVPHPPTENRVGLERAKYIRLRNAQKCIELGLQYPTVEEPSGEIVPQITPIPYTFRDEEDRDKAEKKQRKLRGLGTLLRKRDMENLSDGERREVEISKLWGDSTRVSEMSKVRFPRLLTGSSAGDHSGLSTSSHELHGILKRRPEPIKMYNYQEPWEQPSDEELSPKIGPTREEYDRSGGFGMLGVTFQHEITAGEETTRRELIKRLRDSEKCRMEVEKGWKEDAEKRRELRRLGELPYEKVQQRLASTFAVVSSSDLEEERLVEEMLLFG